MRPSSFFSVLAVTVSSLPTPPLGDLLGANAPDMVFRSRGSLLGPLLGGRRGSGNLLGSLLGDEGVGGILGSLLGGKNGNGNLLGSLLGGNDVGGLLGSLLGDNGVGNLLGSLLGEDGVGGLLDLLLGGQDQEQPGSAEDQQNYFDREGTQDLTHDYTDLDAASRSPKASKGKMINEAGASETAKVSTTSKGDSTPELIE
ncbi:hypothetical protein GGR55DRAFT_678971 [Xylaria sp. FL0064]|nr:hypothetical protein GGR55DRAFT_678971 [Xylaria sp. FL0064]